MPRYGFNFLWMFMGERPEEPDERALDFLVTHGFDFVRIPMSYWNWTTDFDYFSPDERVFDIVDRYVEACRSRDLHLSLNLHRAPGYCINGNDLERHNLWVDEVAQDAFVFLWETFATRYAGAGDVSFDLLNEPPHVGQYGLTRDNHAGLMRRVTEAIRAVDPGREIAIDGLGGGHLAMPELADLGVVHSGRGYEPMPISHHKASWWPDSETAPAPTYPGLQWQGKSWDREALREFYQPWRDVEAAGAGVHIGECGCYGKTPNDVALRWLSDLFGLYREFGWGFALWKFVGDFGIVEHGRPGARYEVMDGYRVDRELLHVIQASMVT
jgi:hypothetical protein